MKNLLYKISLVLILATGLSACDGSGMPDSRKDPEKSGGTGAGDPKKVPVDAAKSDTSRMDSTELDKGGTHR
jgi:hypothetical protein